MVFVNNIHVRWNGDWKLAFYGIYWFFFNVHASIFQLPLLFICIAGRAVSFVPSASTNRGKARNDMHATNQKPCMCGFRKVVGLQIAWV